MIEHKISCESAVYIIWALVYILYSDNESKGIKILDWLSTGYNTRGPKFRILLEDSLEENKIISAGTLFTLFETKISRELSMDCFQIYKDLFCITAIEFIFPVAVALVDLPMPCIIEIVEQLNVFSDEPPLLQKIELNIRSKT